MRPESNRAADLSSVLQERRPRRYARARPSVVERRRNRPKTRRLLARRDVSGEWGGGRWAIEGGESGRKLLKCSGARKPLLVGQSRSDGLCVGVVGIFGKCTCAYRTNEIARFKSYSWMCLRHYCVRRIAVRSPTINEGRGECYPGCCRATSFPSAEMHATV